MNYFIIVFIALMVTLGSYILVLQNRNETLIYKNAELESALKAIEVLENQRELLESLLKKRDNDFKRLNSIEKDLSSCETTLHSYNMLINAF